MVEVSNLYPARLKSRVRGGCHAAWFPRIERMDRMSVPSTRLRVEGLGLRV